MTDLDEQIFSSAHSALLFAFGYNPEQYAPSILAKMIRGGVVGSGKGLVGMDGAGQAGMVLAEIHDLGEAAEHFLAARFAPHYTDCSCRNPCCTGYRPSRTFREGIDWITEAAIGQLEDHQVNFRLRKGLVLRFFGERENMTDLSRFAGVSRDMASQHNAKLLPWLKHEEGKAMHAAIARLKERGFVQ